MIGPEHESVRPSTVESFADAVVFSWADPGADFFGLARVGLTPGDGHANVLLVVFSAGEPVSVLAEAHPLADSVDWADLEVAGVRARVVMPLERWSLSHDGSDVSFDLAFEATSGPLEVGPHDAFARAGGMVGYEQLCTVTGTAKVGGATVEIDGLGQRGHVWGAVDWDAIELSRSVSAWWDGSGIVLSSARPAGAKGHDQEGVTAYLVEPDGEVELALDEARLSTTCDAQGRQRCAGLEMWETEESELPRRAAGQMRCGTTLDLGRLTLHSAFFHWRMEGRDGIGRYDLLRRN